MVTKIKDILSNRTLVTFIAGALLCLFFLRQCNSIENLKQDVKLAQEDAGRQLNNFKAAQDSVTILRNDNGDQLAQIRSFEFDLSNLNPDKLFKNETAVQILIIVTGLLSILLFSNK